MAHNVYIHGLSGAGFRVPQVGGGFGHVVEGGTVQVDLDDHKTQLILNGERDNFVRVTGSGSTTVAVVGLTRYGFRVKDNGGTIVTVKIDSGVHTLDLTKGETRRILRRSFGRYLVTSTETAVTVRGTQNEQNGFDLSSQVAASAVLSSDGTVPTAGDTVTINNVTYRFESTMALANDVKIGASSDATLNNLIAAVNQSGTPGTEYFAGTVAPTDVTAGALVGTGATGKVTLTASTPGTGGNAYASTETSAHLSFGAATFASGAQSGGLSKVYRGTTAVVDPTNEAVYQQLRRHYKSWLEN